MFLEHFYSSIVWWFINRCVVDCLKIEFSTLSFQLFIRFMNDANKDVRNNAIFGLGELALNAGPGVMVQHYPTILQTLSNHLSKGDEARCVDQIVGAVCR